MNCDFHGWKPCTNEAVFEFPPDEGDLGRNQVHACRDHLGQMLPVGKQVTVFPIGLLGWAGAPEMQMEVMTW